MPGRPERLIRLHALLAGQRERTPEELARRLDVSVRTVYRDVDGLDRLGAPIVRGARGWRLVSGAKTTLLLSYQEQLALVLLLEGPHAKALGQGVLDSLRDKLLHGEGSPAEAPRATGPETSGPISQATLQSLTSAIKKHQTCRVLYESIASGSKRWRQLDPYALFHRSDAWYLAARCWDRKSVLIFRLDRISGFDSLDTFFDRDFDLSQYLDDTWRIFRGDETTTAVLEIDEELSAYFRTAQLHPLGRYEELGDGRHRYSVAISHVEDIARFVVAFGGRVRAKAPHDLVVRINAIALNAAREHRCSKRGTVLSGTDKNSG